MSTRSSLVLGGAVAFTILAWASAFVVIRGLGHTIDGGALALGRLVVGTVALGILFAVSRQRMRPTGREWLLLVVYGVGWFGCYNVALNLAEQVLDAGTTAMIVGIGPLLIALGGALVLHERIGRWLGIGLGVAFVGVVLIALAEGARFTDLGGVLGALAAAVTYAIGVIAQKPLVSRLPGIQVTFIGCAIGAIVCLPFAPTLVAELAVASPSSYLGVAYLGIVPTALAFTTWAFALKQMSATALGVTTYVVPVLVIVIALIAFREFPAILAVVGGVISLVGVALSRRRSRVIREAAVDAQTLP